MSEHPQPPLAVQTPDRSPGAVGSWSPVIRAPGRPDAAATGDDTRPAPDTAFRVAASACGVVAVVLAVALGSDLFDTPVREVISDVALILLAAFVAVAAGRAARRTGPGPQRLPWVLLAAAGVSWTAGEAAWFQNRYLADEIADPSMADVFYLLALLPAAVSLMALSRVGAGTQRVRNVLSAIVIGGSVLFVSQALALSIIVPAAGESEPLARVVYIAYPVADIVLTSLALISMVQTGVRRGPGLSLFAFGMLAYAVSDTWYAYLGAAGDFEPGTVWDMGWAVGYLLMGLAAMAPERAAPGAPGAASEPKGLQSLAIYLPVTVAVVVAALRPDPHNDPVLLLSGLVVLLCFLARQLLLTHDNVRLQRTLHAQLAELHQRGTDLRVLVEQTFRVVAAVVDGIVEVDADGRLGYVNPAAARMLGRSPESLRGLSQCDLFAAGADSPASLVTEALHSGQEGTGLTTTMRRADGTTFPVEMTVGPVTEGDQVLGAVVIFRDVTERLEVERMKDEFVSVVSHELRTPLTSIRGSLGLLAGGAAGELSPSAIRMVTIALESSERLTRLINDMLDIERIDSGAAMIEPVQCDAATLVGAAVEGLAGLAATREVRLITGPVKGRVHADPDRIVQTITNLVGNAVKFSPPGAAVTVSAEPVGDMVEFQVQDEGRGIPADRIGRIFERFEQVDASDSRVQGGTGLGLAISRSIVERHGGTMWVESQLGHGSTFHFRLPAVRHTAPTESTTPPGQPTVLLCDDDPAVREEVRAMLARRGYAVTTAPDAAAALEHARTETPDVVLLDLRMPRMSGWEALDALRADERTRDIPVIVISGLQASQDPRLASRTQGWVEKPLSEQSVARSLGAALRGHLARPCVLLVEDDDGLAGVLAATLNRDGVRTVRAAGEQAALALCRDLDPDAVVLDLGLADGSGAGVVRTLRQDPAHGALPLVVYSGRDVAPDEREDLSLGRTVFLTKGRAGPHELAGHLLVMLGLVSPRTAMEPTTNLEAS